MGCYGLHQADPRRRELRQEYEGKPLYALQKMLREEGLNPNGEKELLIVSVHSCTSALLYC